MEGEECESPRTHSVEAFSPTRTKSEDRIPLKHDRTRKKPKRRTTTSSCYTAAVHPRRPTALQLASPRRSRCRSRNSKSVSLRSVNSFEEEEDEFAEPKAPRALLLCLFSFIVAATAGILYAANSAKWLWRVAFESPKQRDAHLESVMAQSLKIYQSADLMTSPLAGIFLDYIGPASTQFTGQLLCAFSCYLLANRSIWWGSFIQGWTVQAICISPLCIADLFRHKQFAVGVITGASELPLLVLPLGVLLVRFFPTIFSYRSTMLFFAAFCLIAAFLGLFLLPHTCFRPLPSKKRKKKHPRPAVPSVIDKAQILVRQPTEKRTKSGPVIVTVTPPSEILQKLNTRDREPMNSIYKPPHPAEVILEEEDEERRDEPKTSTLKRSTLKNLNLAQSLAHPVFICFSFVWCFVVFRMNSYFDMSEGYLEMLGDDGFLAETTSWLVPTSFIWAAVLGGLGDRFGSAWTLVIVNVISVSVSAASLVPYLQFQWVTLFLFILHNGGVFTILYCFVSDTFGTKNLGILTGVASVFAGVFNQLVGSPMVTWVINKNNGDWKAINITQLILGAIATVPAAYIIYALPVTEQSADEEKSLLMQDDDAML